MATTATTAGALPFSIPSGQEIYDGLMQGINPELLTENLSHLDEKYKDESGEERAARYLRYEESFRKYDEAYATWSRELNEAIATYRREAFHSTESQSRQEEDGILSQLENSIQTATPSPLPA